MPAGGFTKPCNTMGTSTPAGYAEHAFTYDVVTRVAVLLRDWGATVVLTRDSDSGFGPCVDERARIGNAAHAAAVIAVHADGGPVSGLGFHVIAPALAPDHGNAEALGPSKQLALAVRSAFQTATGEPYASYTGGSQGMTVRSDLAGLNLSRVPAVMIECGNMRNSTDADRLSSSDWRQRAAVGIAAGVGSYLTAG